jgi:hypothetical protein
MAAEKARTNSSGKKLDGSGARSGSSTTLKVAMTLSGVTMPFT